MAEKKATKAANPAAKKTARADKADGEAGVLAKIAAMPASYRAMDERLHALILRSEPTLRLWASDCEPVAAPDGDRITVFRVCCLTSGRRG